MRLALWLSSSISSSLSFSSLTLSASVTLCGRWRGEYTTIAFLHALACASATKISLCSSSTTSFNESGENIPREKVGDTRLQLVRMRGSQHLQQCQSLRIVCMQSQ